MAKSSALKLIWFLKQIGLEISGWTGDERICTCPSCGKEEHLYFNIRKSVFDCKRCGESGTYIHLLDLLQEDLTVGDASITIRELAASRNLRAAAFAGHSLGHTGDFYVLPVRGIDGKLQDLRRCRIGGKWLSAPSAKAGLFRAEYLGDESRKSERILIAEGEWDTMALEWLRQKAKQCGIVVGVPGAGTFKSEWVPWFAGRHVVTMFDNDDAGARGEARVARMLGAVTDSIQFYRWPANAPEGCDISDVIGGAL